jgi:hypothetical protein
VEEGTRDPGVQRGAHWYLHSEFPGEYGEIVIRTPPLLTSEMKIYQLSMALAWYNHLHSINFAKSKVKRTRKYRPEGVK